MLAVAWLTCVSVLLVAGGVRARIYDRCELARDLRELGIPREHLATWVCIAYHESRLDTAARNPHSGDHGLLQISELYWCGAGKACGLPCSALRDEDIADDVECALHIKEEHDRIQGDGFLAWVVYPQHCKHNPKKYLADCDGLPKNSSVKMIDKPRAINVDYDANVSVDFDYHPNIDQLKSPYLTISTIIEKNYENEVYSYHKNGRMNWLNFKIDNIDELTLPMLHKKTEAVEPPAPKTTTLVTTTSTFAPPPLKAYIETNQFRKKVSLSTPKPSTNKDGQEQYSTARPIEKSTTATQQTTTCKPSTAILTTYSPPVTTTYKPYVIKTTLEHSTKKYPGSSPLNQFTTSLNQQSYSIKSTQTTIRSTRPSITSRLWTTSPFPSTTISWTTPSPWNTRRSSTTTRQLTVSTPSTSSRTITTLKSLTSLKPVTTQFIWTTPRSPTPTRSWTESKASNTFSSWTSSKSLTTRNPWTTRSSWTTTKPSITLSPWTKSRHPSAFGSFTTPKPATTAILSTTSRPTTRTYSSWRTTTSRPQTTFSTPPTFTSWKTTTARPKTNYWITKPTTQSKVTAQSTFTSKTTQSIFDLYLNTRQPKLSTYKFDNLSDSRFKLKIFNAGTTTPVPQKAVTHNPRSPFGGAARNHFRRQTLVET